MQTKKLIYSCNHTEEIKDKIGGEKKINSLCPSCFQKKFKEDSKLGIELAKKYNYPALVGTENQKIAGEAIRYKWILLLEKLKEDRDNNETIENLENLLKSTVSSAFYIQKGNYKEKGMLKTKIETKRKIDWEVIYPKNITQNNCALYFYQNEDNTYFVGFEGTKISKIIEIFHQLNFKWKVSVWEKIFDSKDESLNILSVLINTFLNYGYTISVPKKIKNNIKEVNMKDLYKEELLSKKLSLDVKIADTKTTIFDIEDGQWNKEQLSNYLLAILKENLKEDENELAQLKEMIKKLESY